MTTREEAKAKLDVLSDADFQAVVKLIEHREYVARQMAALEAFASDWTPDEEAAWLEGTKRRPWRATSAGDET